MNVFAVIIAAHTAAVPYGCSRDLFVKPLLFSISSFKRLNSGVLLPYHFALTNNKPMPQNQLSDKSFIDVVLPT